MTVKGPKLTMYDFNDAERQVIPFPQADPVDPVGDFLADMADKGFNPGDRFKAGGDISRFGEKKRQWCLMFPDGLAGVYGDFKTGEKHHWYANGNNQWTQEQRAHFERQWAEAKKARDKEKARRNKAAQVQAGRIWETGVPAPPDHAYLKAKGVQSYDLKIDQAGRLIVPMKDSDGALWSLQYIPPNGKDKRFLKGGRVKGLYHIITGNDQICIVEGYATGATVAQATGATVVMAFNSGNLKPVAKAVRANNPQADITICGDNDQFTDGNPGKKAAREAADAINARFVLPQFDDISDEPTDFNDLARLNGPGAVKDQITAPSSPAIDFDAWDADGERYQGDPPPYYWLVENTFPLGAVSIIAAAGDTGKGILTADLGLKIAQGPTGNVIDKYPKAFGNDVIAHGTTVIFTAEDDQNEVHRRICNIDRAGERFRHKGKLKIVPLPNAGGPQPLITSSKAGPEATPFYYEVKAGLTKYNDIKLIVFDPLASFVAADINADPAVGAFTTGKLAALAAETGAAVVIIHHVNKGDFSKPIRTADQARHAIRGTTAIVDGVRAAYALWPADYKKAEDTCRRLEVEYQPNKVFMGALVKSNGPGDRTTRTYVRNGNGLLTDRTDQLKQTQPDGDYLKQVLVDDIADAAKREHPFTRHGKQDGLYARRNELNDDLKECSRDKLVALADDLIMDGAIVTCKGGSKRTLYLDVPNGPFAIGTATVSGVGKTK